MSARDLVITSSKGTMKQYTHFLDGFETVWKVTVTRSLKCDRESRNRASTWFNNHKIMIMLITGVDLDDLEFEEPRYGDIATMNANRRKMLQYFTFSFVAYVKYCQTMKREIDRNFGDINGNARIRELEQVEDGVD